MKRTSLLFFLWLITSTVIGQNWNKYSVFFGERSEKLESPSDNVIRIFLDQEGSIYPDITIKDRQLRKNKSSIKTYLEANEATLHQLCERYGTDKTLDTPAKLHLLDTELADKYIQLINSQVDQYEAVYVLIHGFRKRAYGKAMFLSIDDNEQLKKDISKNGRKNLFIEIYWDGKYITPIQGYKYKGFKLMEQSAIPNAKRAGISLRKILPAIRVDTLNIVAHSLGAILTSELLFNTQEQKLPTPSQNRVNICLLAPAIGSEYFESYYHRNSTVDYKHRDNYHLYIVQNKNDFVLNKSFKWGIFDITVKPTEFGNTSLGCNYENDGDKLIQLFKDKYNMSSMPEIILIDTNNDGSIMKCHLISCYSRNNKFSAIDMFKE